MICFWNVKKIGSMKHLKRSIKDERVFSLVNAGNIRLAKISPGIAFYYISNTDNSGALVELESQFDCKYELAERQTKKAATCYKTVAEFTEWHGFIAEFTEWHEFIAEFTEW